MRSTTPASGSATATARTAPTCSLEIERSVIGGDWGANGYTTLSQADQLADALRLAPGVQLLDLGAGRGWPGLYLAVRTGCRVVLSDVPLEGLHAAVARAATDGVADRVAAVASSARALPFQAGTSTRSSTPTCCVDCGPSSPC